jgi:diaminopimelate decarboxylase
MDTNTRAAPILPDNKIMCITDIIVEPGDYIEAQITELTTEVITTGEEAPPATTDPSPAKVPRRLEQNEKRVPKARQ